MMSEINSAELVFTGAEPVSDFIRKIKRHAFESEKQRDMEWMADFASLCFADEALRWFAELDPSVAGDWIRLQRALLEKYPDKKAETPVTNIPDYPPAAPPPTAQDSRRLSVQTALAITGRIRIISSEGMTGYVSRQVDSKTGVFRWTATAGDALAVYCIPKCQPQKIKLENRLGDFRYLGGAHLFGSGRHMDFRGEGTAYLNLCAASNKSKAAAPHANSLKYDSGTDEKLPGPTHLEIWNVLSVIASVRENGYTHMLTFVMSTMSKNIYLAINFDAFVHWSPHSNFVKLRLVLEPNQ